MPYRLSDRIDQSSVSRLVSSLCAVSFTPCPHRVADQAAGATTRTRVRPGLGCALRR